MFCTKCGNQLAEGTAFCPKCGTQVAAQTVAAAETQPTVANEPANVVVKSKREFIYEKFCNYMTMNPMIVGFNPTFGQLENYEEGADGMVYCELVASSRNALGKTKNTRFGAVVQEVEADGNVIFKGAGPQLVTPLTGAKVLKTVLGFKKA